MIALVLGAAASWATFELLAASYRAWVLDHAHESLRQAMAEVQADEGRWAC
ncbi:MAG: hypothetical protein LC640_09215 [Frankia sp.]|nr:hypothetical protein [Frankia sp.]